MKAHIVGGGFGGLAAAAYLVRDAGMSGQDITVYEADDRLGGAFSLAGDAATGYILPTGASLMRSSAVRSTFSRQSPRWAIRRFPSRTISSPSMTATRTTTGHTSSTGRSHHARPHFGLSMRDRLELTPEAMLDGRRIDEFFRADFFATEFWLLWTTIMGPLPQHSAMEMRRYMNRFLAAGPVGHVARPAHALRPVRGHHRTYGGVAAPAWRDLPDETRSSATSASRHRPAASRPAGSTTNATARQRRSSSRRRISCW